MIVEVSKRDYIAAGAAAIIILVLFLPSILVHFNTTKTSDEDKPIINKLSKLAEENRWFRDAQSKLKQRVKRSPNSDVRAKNIIFFLGDGMGISTLTAARKLKNQRLHPSNIGIEEQSLSFENFPDVSLVKTYCSDHLVADSACSATAYLTGIKGNKDTIGVSDAVKLDDCEAQLDLDNHQFTSLLYWAQEGDKVTGVVTTDKLTGASPSGTFAHTANRDWENDQETPEDCPDIASQLIRNRPGNMFRVILGGGGMNFNNSRHHSDGRTDGSDLITEWINNREAESQSYEFVNNRRDLVAVDVNETDYLFGIFNEDEFLYKLDIGDDHEIQPRLFEMTSKALEILQRHDEGFVLFIEAAHIDKAHHENWAKKALEEVLELDKAVTTALEMVNTDETLIIVTADHSHSLTISGYPRREYDILGFDGGEDSQQVTDEAPQHFYPTLMYATGPGTKHSSYDVSRDERLRDKDFVYPSTVFRESASHQGEDVALYAVGPQSHLFNGLIDQHLIPHILGYAGCIGNGLTLCDKMTT